MGKETYSISLLARFFCALIIALVCSCSFNPFDPHKKYCSISVRVVGNGTVSLDPSRPSVYPGTDVSILCRPDSGNMFVGIFGDVRSTDDPLVTTVKGNLSLEARFAPQPAASMAKISAWAKRSPWVRCQP